MWGTNMSVSFLMKLGLAIIFGVIAGGVAAQAVHWII
jgi:hypothetical protein